MNQEQGRRTRRAGSLFGIVLVTAGVTAIWGTPTSAAAPERSLAGIRIFSRQSEVLKKYGNPSQVIVGGSSTSISGGGAGSAGGGFGSSGGYPGGAGGFGGSGGATSGAGGLGAPPGFGGTPGGLPGFGASPDGGAPGEFGAPEGIGGRGGNRYGGGGPSAGGFGGAPGAGTTVTASSKEVTWIYDQKDGSSLEFTISSDGRVVQIRATGFKSSVRTSKGLALGQTYKDAILRYGAPESQSIAGNILNINYSERNHAAFQFYNQKLVGIVVAAVE